MRTRLLNRRQGKGLAVDDAVEDIIVVEADVIQIGVVADDGKAEVGGVRIDQGKIGVKKTAFGLVGANLGQRDDQLRLGPVDEVGGSSEIQTWRAQFIVKIIPQDGDGHVRGLVDVEAVYELHIRDRRIDMLLGISDRAEVRVHKGDGEIGAVPSAP